MLDRIKKYINKNPHIVLFVFSFIYLLLLGILLSYNYDIKNNANLIFDSDTSRVILDATEIVANHYRVSVHPLFVLLIQPLCFILNGIVLNKMLSIIILSALASSLSTLLIYKLLDKIRKDDKTNILISLIYLFSFSNIVFTSSIETYNFASLFLILLYYFYVSKKDRFNIFSYIVLIILGILSIAFTITNFVIFLIIMFILFLDKKINIKNSIITLIIIGISVVGLSIYQKVVWNTTPVIWGLSVGDETTEYADHSLKVTNVKRVVENDYYNSIISSDIYLNIKYGNTFNNQNYIITFASISIISLILLTIFYLLTIILLVRNFKKNKFLNIGLLLSLGFNTCLHIIYGNDSTFLYSLHFVYLIILLFAVNYLFEENKNLKTLTSIFIPLLLIAEVLINNKTFIKVLSYVNDNINKHILLANLGPITILLELLIIVFITIIIFLIIYIYKIIKKEKNKEKKIVLTTSIIGLIIIIETIFIVLNAIEENHKFIKFELDSNKQIIEPKDKSYYSSNDFKDYFKEELSSLKLYEQELTELKNTYNHQDKNNLNWSEYYYFGMANRKKIFYINNKLIEIDSKKVIKKFDEKEHFVIPNIHTVIIKTTDDKYIKIMEDEEGIHYIVNGKDELLDNTKLELYNFDNQKYQNIKKVLYGELLFNIKDGVIYPNIIVYDKPWYRDAALTCMVLKQTNNTDLISNWVNSITEIYDLQNDNNQEPDNLGELLYILSTQNNLNIDLIDKIEEEANRLASSNPDGYYIYGKTDFGDQYLYQNLWYKFGIESVDRKFKFDLDNIPEDSYSKMAWWSDYELKDNNPYQVSEEYPYLSYAANHKMNNSIIPLNENNYPLTWESYASQANYENYYTLDKVMSYSKTSPIHSWSASELLLWLMDETGNLNIK